MTPRAALAVLSVPRAENESADQHELDRYMAIETIAKALGLSDEAAAAHQVAEALHFKDEQQLRLFKLLEARGE